MAFWFKRWWSTWKGLPERRLVNEIKKGNTSFEKLRETLNFDFNAAIANAKKNNWIKIIKKEDLPIISLTDNIEESLEEKFLKKCKESIDKEPNKMGTKEFLIPYESLKKRSDFIVDASFTREKISITNEAKESSIPYESLKKRPHIIDENISTTKKFLITDEGKKINLSEIGTPAGAINVEADVPEVFVAKNPSFTGYH